MSVDQKMALVTEHKDVYGLNRCLEAFQLSAGTWYYRQKREDPSLRDETLRQAIVDVVGEHPEYGYRRLLPDVSERLGEPVNHKRLRRVLCSYELGLKRSLPNATTGTVDKVLNAFRGHLDLVKGRTDIKPMEVFSTDFTELVYGEGKRKAHLAAYVDVKSKVVIGWAVAPSADRRLALTAWRRAKKQLAHYGLETASRTVHSDQDAVYRSHDYLSELILEDGIRISFSERGCKDNPWIESLWGRMKVEIGSQIEDAATLSELEGVINQRMNYYNHERRNSETGNQPPIMYFLTNRECADAQLAKMAS